VNDSAGWKSTPSRGEGYVVISSRCTIYWLAKKMLTVSSSFSKLAIVMVWEVIIWSYLS